MRDLIKKNIINQESKKRKREILLIFVISILLAFLIGVEVYVFRSGQNLPAPYIIYFIGLVNFNLVLVLLLLFLIFRNVVKIFLERRSKLYGSSLKSKLTVAFAAFSVIPTTLVLILSVFYLNSSFEKWFSGRMVGVLKNASEVVDSFLVQEKRRGYEYADAISDLILNTPENQIQNQLKKLRENYKLDAVEYYSEILADRKISQDYSNIAVTIPKVQLDFLQKGMLYRSKSSVIHIFSESHLLRMMSPLEGAGKNKGVVVVSKILNLSPGAKLDDIIGSYQELQNNLLIEYPLKSMYFIMQIVMSLVTLFAAVWFGFHMAKQLSVPLVQLGRATKKVAGGDYSPLEIRSGSEEINNLIGNFNQMISNLSSSELELQQTLKNLNQYTKYVEIVLGNVSAGVLSVDMNGHVTTMNRRAGELLSVDPIQAVNRHFRQVVTDENYQVFSNFVRLMQENKLTQLQKEIRVDIDGESIPLSVHISILKNELQEEIGRIMVFDDMTVIINAQRAAAWSEVARRIAHEIKNPLTPIRLAAERISRKYGTQISDQAFTDSIQMIITQVDDMRDLVNEFSQFARLPQLKPIETNLNQVLADASQIYKDNHSEVQFTFLLDADLPNFKFDPSQMKRVFANLVDNAVAATEKKSDPKVWIQTEYQPQLQIVKISVSDNGVGIPQRDRARVFEPYYSTKEKGTGLGLPIVKSIIEDHQGVIRALPNDPRGTKMYIEMPVNI
jgi:two-component system, NtrC family, nitrogen regulation sensor histidine kinase NtrY